MGPVPSSNDILPGLRGALLARRPGSPSVERLRHTGPGYLRVHPNAAAILDTYRPQHAASLSRGVQLK